MNLIVYPRYRDKHISIHAPLLHHFRQAINQKLAPHVEDDVVSSSLLRLGVLQARPSGSSRSDSRPASRVIDASEVSAAVFQIRGSISDSYGSISARTEELRQLELGRYVQIILLPTVTLQRCSEQLLDMAFNPRPLTLFARRQFLPISRSSKTAYSYQQKSLPTRSSARPASNMSIATVDVSLPLP